MKKLNLDTKNFESRVTEGVVVARFKEHAMDILTDVEAGSGFLDFLERANDETGVAGFVQVNDGEWDSQADVYKLGQFFSENEEMHVKHGRDYGYLHDVVAARFRNTIGRYLRTRQEEHGGWPLYLGGDLDISCTVKAYYALKMIGDSLIAQFDKEVDIRYVWNVMDFGYKSEDVLWMAERGILPPDEPEPDDFDINAQPVWK